MRCYTVYSDSEMGGTIGAWKCNYPARRTDQQTYVTDVRFHGGVTLPRDNLEMVIASIGSVCRCSPDRKQMG